MSRFTQNGVNYVCSGVLLTIGDDGTIVLEQDIDAEMPEDLGRMIFNAAEAIAMLIERRRGVKLRPQVLPQLDMGDIGASAAPPTPAPAHNVTRLYPKKPRTH